MGIRLIVEVLDHAPATLTPRERYALAVLAEDARDETRLCSKGVESNEKVMRRFRAGLSERKAILKALIDKGAIERTKRGQKHRHAEFRILPLTPAQGPGNPDAEPVDNDSQGPDSALSGAGFSGLSSRETRPPSPQSPQDPSSLSAAERKIMSAVGATTEEAREIIRIIETKKKLDSLPAYVATLARNGDLAGFLDRVRAGERAAGPPSASTPIPVGYAELLTRDPCPHGMPGGDRARPGAGTPACPECRYETTTATPPAPRPAPKPAAPRDLATLRETLGSLTTRTGPRRPALNIQPPAAIAEIPRAVQAARAYLSSRGDFADWMTSAREKLDPAATRDEVVVLAAELAQGG